MNEMKIIDVIPGTVEWHKHRANHFNASDAPAMLGVSSLKTRTELLDEAKIGYTKEISEFTQKIFNRGHAAEISARVIIEDRHSTTFYPLVGIVYIDEICLAASFDGLTMSYDLLFEHKIINKNLRNIRNINDLDKQYKVQMQQQMMVSGAKECIFVASDGTNNDMIEIRYLSDINLEKEIIEGWKQFKIDLENHEVKTKEQTLIPAQKEFPLMTCEVKDSNVISNINEYIPALRQMANEQMSLVLETDQDFANKDAFNKQVKLGREQLKSKILSVEMCFNSFSEFNAYAKEADSILQKMQSAGEKQVKEAKESKKINIIIEAKDAIEDNINIANNELGDNYIRPDTTQWSDLIKGMRSIDSINDAIFTECAKINIRINKTKKLIIANIELIDKSEMPSLFPDKIVICLKDKEDVENLIKSRILEHENNEKEKQLKAKEVELAKEAQRVQQAKEVEQAKEVQQAKEVELENSEQAAIAETKTESENNKKDDEIPEIPENAENAKIAGTEVSAVVAVDLTDYSPSIAVKMAREKNIRFFVNKEGVFENKKGFYTKIINFVAY